MSKYTIGVFGDDHELVEAVTKCRESGWEIHDCYTPFAVHGLERAMGLARSRITLCVFAAGTCAFFFALWLQWYIRVQDWPINIGGKPQMGIPAWIPIMFELTVLISGLTNLMVLFGRSNLFPGKKEKLVVPGVTDDKFAVVLVQGSGYSKEKAEAVLRGHGALEVREVTA